MVPVLDHPVARNVRFVSQCGGWFFFFVEYAKLTYSCKLPFFPPNGKGKVNIEKLKRKMVVVDAGTSDRLTYVCQPSG